MAFRHTSRAWAVRINSNTSRNTWAPRGLETTYTRNFLGLKTGDITPRHRLKITPTIAMQAATMPTCNKINELAQGIDPAFLSCLAEWQKGSQHRADFLCTGCWSHTGQEKAANAKKVRRRR